MVAQLGFEPRPLGYGPNVLTAALSRYMAEAERFELPGLLHPTVFKTATLTNVRASAVSTIQKGTGQ